MRWDAIKVRSLSSRLALVFALLFTVVQASVLLLVDRFSAGIARERNAEELQVGERVFLRLLDQNQQRLLQAAEVLSKDFAFRQAVATGDSPTIPSVLHNHGARVQASVMMLVSPDNVLIADSLHPGAARRPFPRSALIRSAQQRGKASALLMIDNRLYQVVVVPVLAPDPIAWVAMGFLIDAGVLSDLRAITSLHVSFLGQDSSNAWQVLATTRAKKDLEASLYAVSAQDTSSGAPLRLGGFDTTVATLAKQGSDPLKIVLQRSVSEGMEPLDRLKSLLLLLTLASIGASIIGSVVLARRITHPLAALTQFAKRVRDGDYSGRIELKRGDEVGAVATSFNHMLEGIAAREAEVMRLAYEDTLTGLPNRAMFNDRLTQAVKLYRRAGAPVAVLVMDLNRFKYINDTLGHGAGDVVLQEVAKRLRNAVRESDTVARLGGDEFGILLATGSSDRALVVARMIDAVLEEPIEIDGQPVDVGSSIGIAQCPAHGEEAGVLLRHADVAMYEAKQQKSGVAVYEPSYDKHRAEQLSLLSDLRKAIAAHQLKLHYQPKVDLRRGRLVGVEALVRWEHPDRGLLPPSEFIPFAEQTGVIREVTRWVIPEAMRQCGVWLAEGVSLSISINVSTRDLLDRELPGIFGAATRAHGVPTDLVIVEVTESALMENPQRVHEIMRELKHLGLRLAIDDYGTGYSSLAYIQRLQCDELKVDRTFVTHISGRDKDAAIVRSTIDLGHSLGLTVVAEGVEDAEVMGVLRKLGCDLGQGFGICRPLPPEQLMDWIASCEWQPKQLPDPMAGAWDGLPVV
jgi:diguanylate cyclase (GGDEF)-like protein